MSLRLSRLFNLSLAFFSHCFFVRVCFSLFSFLSCHSSIFLFRACFVLAHIGLLLLFLLLLITLCIYFLLFQSSIVDFSSRCRRFFEDTISRINLISFLRRHLTFIVKKHTLKLLPLTLKTLTLHFIHSIRSKILLLSICCLDC